MAVHDAVIAADKLRLEQGDTELRAPFSPPASLSAAPGEDNVLFGGPGMCCIIICVPSIAVDWYTSLHHQYLCSSILQVSLNNFSTSLLKTVPISI